MQEIKSLDIEESDSKSSLKEFIQSYEPQFKRYDNYLKKESNFFGSKDLTFKVMEFELQRDMVAIVLDRLKTFNKKFNAYFDLKYVLDFGLFMEDIAEHFIGNCEFYLEHNKWEDLYDHDDLESDLESDIYSIEKAKNKGKELKFQSQVVNALAKFRDILANYKVIDDSDVIDMSLPIEGDKNVPFLMKEKVEKIFKQVSSYEELSQPIATYTSSYDLNNSKEFFKNIKNPPPYDRFKSFWEQGKDVIDFYTEEKNKIINGVTIGGVNISGFLYWHTNFFKTPLPPEAVKGRPEYDPNKKNIITTPNLRDNELFFDYFYRKAESEGKGLFIFGTRRFAKALSNDETLLYADGSIRPIGLCQVGDFIIGGDGNPTQVRGVYPQGKVELYNVIFSDGRSIKCCKEHLWEFSTYQDSTNPEKCVERYFDVKPLKEWENYNIKKLWLPPQPKITYSRTEYTFIDPYLLGMWLSSGSCEKSLRFDINENTKGYIRNFRREYGFLNKYRKGRTIGIQNPNTMTDRLMSKGVYKNKHIPMECFFWDEENKVNLLKGIVHTKVVNPKNSITLSLENPSLTFGVYRLFMEVGVNPSIRYAKDGRVILDIPKLSEFLTYKKVDRKTKRNHKEYKQSIKDLRERKGGKQKPVTIKYIEPCGEGKATCIEVNNECKTFLTTNFVVTHNTTIEASVLSRSATVFPNSQNLVIGGSDGDLSTLSEALESCFLNVHPAFFLPRNNNDWKKHIQFGLKHKSGERIPYSDIYIRNVNAGKGGGELKVAGNTPDVWVVDEGGKFDVAPVYEQGRPSFDTPYGMRLVPILVGCLTKDNYLFNKKGVPIKVEDAVRLGNEVAGWDGSKCSVETISYKNPLVTKLCKKVTFDNSISVSCSIDHPFMQLINTPKFFRKNCIFEGRAKAASLQDLEVGDNVAFPDFLHFHKTTIRNFYKGGKSNYIAKGKLAFLSNEKTFGDTLLSTGRNIARELLLELFKLNGGASFKGRHYFFWNFPNTDLLREAQFLLMKVGIHTTQNIDNNLLELRTKSDVDGYRAFRDIFDGSGLLSGYEGDICLKGKDYDDYLRRRRFYFEYDKENGKGEYYTGSYRNKINNVREAKIVSIEDIGEQFVYNFTADKTHTYIANGAITFNTGGNAKFSASAQDMLTNPEAYGLVSMDWDYLDNMIGGAIEKPYQRRSFGVFVPAHLSYKEGLIKDKTNLADYYGVTDKRLKDIELEVTNWERAQHIIDKDRELKKKSRDSLNSEKMAYPIDPLECFLATHDSPFTCIKEAIALRDRLRSDGDVGEYVELFRGQNGNVIRKPSEKGVPDFPFKGGNIDAPVVIFEPPPEVASFNNTYVSGLDHYKHEKSSTDSVGVMYTFKRKIDLDLWSNRFVATYASRPDTMKEFNKNCELILDAYGSQVLQENADISFQHFLADKNRAEFLLAKGEEMVKLAFNPRANQNNKFGLNPTKTNHDYIFKLFINYCNEELGDGTDGNITKGVERIPDPYLLDEIIGFYYGGNFDRIIAAAHALAWARYLDGLNILPNQEKIEKTYEHRKEIYKRKQRLRNPYFGMRKKVKKPSKNKYNL